MAHRLREVALRVLVGVVILLPVGCAKKARQPRGRPLPRRGAQEPFVFVVLGDTRPGLPAEPNDLASVSIHYLEHIHWINRLRPDFSINAGDIIVGYHEPGSSLTVRQWNKYDKASRVLTSAYFMVVGNHDVWDETSAKLYRRRYGPLHYSFDHGGCHFTVLSSETPGEVSRIGPSQLSWLEKDLAAAQGARHRFVFLHKPLWSTSQRYWSGHHEHWMADVHPLLMRYNVDTVFAGHDHFYEFTEIDGIRYVITGGGGAELMGFRAIGAFYHFLTVAIPAEGRPEITVVEREWTYPQDIVRPGPRRWVESLIDVFASQTLMLGQTSPQTVRYTVHNELAEPVTVHVAWDPNAPLGAVEPAARTIHLDPNGEGTASFVLHLAGGGDWQPQLTWSLWQRGVELFNRVQGLHVIRSGYYATDEATAASAPTLLQLRRLGQVPIGPDNWDGPADCSAQARLIRGADGFRVRVTVVDDKLRADGRYNYERDSVEIYMDVRPPEKRAKGGHEKGTFQMLLLPDLTRRTAAIEVQYGIPALAVPGAKATSTLLPGEGYRIEVFIPLAGLRDKHYAVGETFNFDLGVNDADTQPGRDSQLMWSGTGSNFMSTVAFGRMAPAKP